MSTISYRYQKSMCVCVCVYIYIYIYISLCWELLQFILSNLHIYHTVVITIIIMLYITFLVLLYLIPGSMCLLTIFIQFLHPQPLRATANMISFFSMSLSICLDSTYKWDHTVSVFLCLTYFAWCNDLKFHSCCLKCQDFLMFCG